MLKKFACFGFVASLTSGLALPAPAFAQEQATQWQIDQSDSGCRAVATNPPENVPLVFFTASLRSLNIDFFALIRETVDFDANYSIDFMPTAQEAESALLSIPATASPTYNPDARLDLHAEITPYDGGSLLDHAAPLGRIDIKKGSAGSIASLPITDWQAVEAALRGCIDEVTMLRKQQRPPEMTGENAPYASIPRGNVKARVQYPPRALREGVSGWVRVRLDINVLGYPTDCTIVETSGSEHFNREGCKLERVAQFYTARNAEDEPIAGSWETTLRFELAE